VRPRLQAHKSAPPALPGGALFLKLDFLKSAYYSKLAKRA